MSVTNISKFVGNFSRNLGNGIAMGQNTLDAVNHAIKTGDTSILALMLDKVEAKKDGSSNFQSTIRSIWSGVSINIDKKTNQYRIKTKNATLSNSSVDTLNQLVADGISMRGSKWSKAFNTETEPKEFDAAKYAQGIAKRNPERIKAMIAALQVVQKELETKAALDIAA
jgi:hypothetical protein